MILRSEAFLVSFIDKAYSHMQPEGEYARTQAYTLYIDCRKQLGFSTLHYSSVYFKSVKKDVGTNCNVPLVNSCLNV